MTKKEIATQYIRFLQEGDMESVIGLFAERSIVHSPVYGDKPPAEFFSLLANDTQRSVLSVKGIFEDRDSGSVALYFNYEWTLKSNTIVRFDVVDIIRFNTSNKITELTIIYDTAEARMLLREMKG